MALGKERTRNELLPYIMDLMDDDEEVLVNLATILNGEFLDHVGGPLFAPHLFKPLERLCELEEAVVRDKVSQISIQSFRFLITLFSFLNCKFKYSFLFCAILGGGEHQRYFLPS